MTHETISPECKTRLNNHSNLTIRLPVNFDYESGLIIIKPRMQFVASPMNLKTGELLTDEQTTMYIQQMHELTLYTLNVHPGFILSVLLQYSCALGTNTGLNEYQFDGKRWPRLDDKGLPTIIQLGHPMAPPLIDISHK